MDTRFALLLACFLLSGFAALLYQTAWTRELSFVFGTSELAVAAVLAAYMGGLALGAAAAARFGMRLRRPILAYGLLELAIAVSALAVPAGIDLVNAAYVALFGGGAELPETGFGATALFQLAGSFAVLMPPTAFMGATLPLLARHAVRSDAQLGSRVGLLYAINTAGAIAGTVFAAFWLIPEMGLRRTTWVGAALNGAVFALAAVLARGAPLAPEVAGKQGARADRVGIGAGAWVLPAIALSGAVSFAYEVLWTRLLGHVLGASLHAFATMLASFLLGIALGSAVAARLATTRERARTGFAIAQLGIAVTSYLAFAFADRLPELAASLGAGMDDPLASAAVAAAALLPITLCIGATFPFAVRILAERSEEATRVTARVYAWNTVGAIAGSLAAGFALLPHLRFEGTVALGVAASLALAALAAFGPRPRRAAIGALAAAAALALALLPPRPPWNLLRQSPFGGVGADRGPIAYSAVGRSSTVLLTETPLDWRLATNGLPEAGIERAGTVPMPGSISYWLGLLPPLVRPGVRDLLVVGFGGGTAIEAVPSTVTRIDVIELEPEVIAANRAIAAGRARDPLADPRVRVHIGDARGSLRLTTRQYDAIVSQPSHPWTAGASHLYTREFFSLVRSRLAPHGVFVQWIGLHFVDEALVRSLAASLVEVFGHVEVFTPGERGLLFAASAQPLGDLAGAGEAIRAASADYARFGVHRVEDFAAARLLDADGVRALAEGAPSITDDHNRLATRASRLGRAHLTPQSTRALFARYDPLVEDRGGLDRSVLLRTLVLRADPERAADLARRADGAAEERGLGWVALAKGALRRADRHFARARELDPEDRDALVGLVATRRAALGEGPVAEVPEAELDPSVAAVVASWRHARRGEWTQVTALDAELARIAPGDALYREAARTRALARLETGGPEAAAEATAIVETLLSYFWQPEDALLHARAAAAADRPLVARGSLQRIARVAPRSERGRELARRALVIAQGLPDEIAATLRAELSRHLQGRRGAAGAASVRGRPALAERS